MNGPKPQKRIPVDLEMRVWGMGADGRFFSQHARARNVSVEGALLSDIDRELKIGDTIALQTGDKKARCRVIWARNTGSPQKVHAGVRLLDGQECPWMPSLVVAASSSEQNRRRWERHKIIFVILLQHPRWPAPMRVSATDISARGCYVEMIAPLPIGTGVTAGLQFGAETIMTPGFVRACDPGVGMGIEFMGLTEADQQRFQKYLRAKDPFSCSIEVQRPGSGTAQC